MDLETSVNNPMGNVRNAGVDFVRKNKKPLMIGAGVLVVLLVLVLVLTSFGDSYKTPYKEVLAAINKGEKADILEMTLAGMPDLASNMFTTIAKISDRYAELFEEAGASVQEKFEELSDEYENWELTFEFSDTEKLDKDDMEDYYDELENLWDNRIEDLLDEVEDILEDPDELEETAEDLECSEEEVKELIKTYKQFYTSMDPDNVRIGGGYKVRGCYVLKNGSKEIDKTNKVTSYVLKINGDWVIYNTKSGDSYHFDSSKKNYNLYSFLPQYLNRGFYSIFSTLSSLG